MAIQVNWVDHEQTLIHMKIEGEVNWYEFYARTGEVSKMLADVRHTVDIILEVPAEQPLHPDFMMRLHLARIFHLTNGATVLLQPMPPTKTRLIDLLRPQTKSANAGQPITAGSLKEAHDIIASHRRTRAYRSL